MRLLTYNIHGWKGSDGRVDVERLARIILTSQADVVGLNEVFHPYAVPGDERPALDVLAETLGMTYAFGVALTPQFAFAPSAAYGNALLARLPLLAHASHHLTTAAGHEQRGLLEARLLLPDGRTTLSVYITHLDQRSEAVRMQQTRALLQWVGRDRARPHVLMGDFNALSLADYEGRARDMEALRNSNQSAHMLVDGAQVLPRLLRAGYVDRFTPQTGQQAYTYPASAPAVRIDYILVSQPLAAATRRCQVWETPDTALASDHLPLLAAINL